MPGTRGPVPVPLKDGTRDVTQLILEALENKPSLVANAEFPDIPQNEIKAALDRLASRSMVTYETQDAEHVLLTPEAQQICEQGSHEYRVWDAVRRKGKLEMKELVTEVGDAAKIGQGTAMKNKWIKKEGSALVPATDKVEDTTRIRLQEAQSTKSIKDADTLKDYRKRKLVTTVKAFSYTVDKGPKYAKVMPVEVTDLTEAMLRDGSWETANFKPYNFSALGASQDAGALHPINEMREIIRRVFFYLGFGEMSTSRYVESGFWNFDALYVPQQHPARDLQDTFYVADPPKADRPRPDPEMEKAMEEVDAGFDMVHGTKGSKEPRDYDTFFENVKKVHEGDAFGSIGYRYPWSEDECLRLSLRTHTTALTGWTLHRLAQNPRPARYFSIDRVFRNETTDATHLAEFHQVEGVIADWDFSLPEGMGFLRYFFETCLKMQDISFKPAYNPYTEPSMEVYGYHPGLKKRIEIGNSGLFRPEMLEPLGLPKNLRVFGFGLSVERPTMILTGANNIRDLVGHKVDLDFIKNSPAVRLD